jgi:dihydroorotase
MSQTHSLKMFLDAHLHLRRDEMLETVLPHTMKHARCAVIMPNTRPVAIIDAMTLVDYRDEILHARDAIDKQSLFEPLMTIEIRDTTTPLTVFRAHEAGAVAGKVYPVGVTTNSGEGLRDFTNSSIRAVFQAMSDCGMKLLLHGEVPHDGVLITDRERQFLPTLFYLAANFPRLKIVLEHVSTKEGVEAVRSLGSNVAGTITLHHLMLTLNDVLVGGTHPHNMCNPVPKGFDDRQALLKAATESDHSFFLGSDSAPHRRESKECTIGACGVFSAPVLAQGLAVVFDKAKRLSQLENFAMRNGLRFYGLPFHEAGVTLAGETSYVPEIVGDVVPFLAGQKLPFNLVA